MASLKMILIFLSLEVYFSSAQRQNSTLPASVPLALSGEQAVKHVLHEKLLNNKGT